MAKDTRMLDCFMGIDFDTVDDVNFSFWVAWDTRQTTLSTGEPVYLRSLLLY